MRRAGVLLLVLSALAACEQKPLEASSDARPPVEETYRHPEIIRPEIIRRQPVRLYPEASTVKLFVAKPSVRGVSGVKFERPEGQLLSRTDRERLEAALHLQTWSGIPDQAACFIPHHFLKYYDASGKEIGEIQICFCCEGVAASPGLPGEGTHQGQFSEPGMDRAAVEAVIRSLGYRTDIDCGQ